VCFSCAASIDFIRSNKLPIQQRYLLKANIRRFRKYFTKYLGKTEHVLKRVVVKRKLKAYHEFKQELNLKPDSCSEVGIEAIFPNYSKKRC
jgi:hypothetical protein